MNENCLEGMKCPDCGNYNYFRVSALVTTEVTDDGAEVDLNDGMEWTEESLCICPDCQKIARVKDFKEPKK